MKTLFLNPTLRAGISLGLIWQLSSPGAVAQSLRIDHIERAPSGQVTIRYQTVSNAQYILLQGNTLTNINRPVVTNSGVSGTSAILLSAQSAQSFFRLQRMDGPPAITSFVSSPANGDTDVSVTRETILYFSNPLAADTLITTNNFHATASGRRLLTRVELSSDRRKASLFYLEPVPGSSRVTVTFDASAIRDASGKLVDADANGSEGGVGIIGYDTLSTTPVAGTAVIGRVFASELVPGPGGTTNTLNRPLAGVTITVDGREETLRAVTDAMGNFTLSPCPSGKFFVHIDGQTSRESQWPNGAYYPVVGKEWEAAAGRMNNLAGGTGEIFLPLIRPGTLQPVSVVTNTTITFPPAVIADNPALAGVTVTVPANSLFSDNGTRGGRVGIAPVAPNRLPGPLPPGLEFPLVITVQTDGGQNFDQPVPVRFPNLPDPQTGEKLQPGAKSALWSFNHDTGQWEVVGSMTVTGDGNFVESDPGIGLLQPGWHGSFPGSSVFALGSYCVQEDCCGLEDRAIACDNALYECLATGVMVNELLETNLTAGAQLDPLIATLQSFLSSYARLTSICQSCQVELGPAAAGSPDAVRALVAGDQASIDDLHSAVRTARSQGTLSPQLASRIGTAKRKLQDNNPTRDDAFRSHSRSDRAKRIAKRNLVTSVNLGPGAYTTSYNSRITTRSRTTRTGQFDAVMGASVRPVMVALFDPTTRTVGLTAIDQVPAAGANLELSSSVLGTPVGSTNTQAGDVTGVDLDGDGLSDIAEFVMGTSLANPDSDSDGIPDGAEIENGTDPLDNFPARTGVIFSADTPGNAVDVCSVNNVAVIADSEAGVAVFNALNGLNPVRVAQVDTPGSARRVACAGNLIAVADHSAGLAVIDVTRPADAGIVRQVNLGGNAIAVAAAGGTAYVGLDNGQVVTVDMLTGSILQRVNHTQAVHDLGIDGETLFVLLASELRSYSLAGGSLLHRGTVPLSGFQPEGITGLRRLGLGGGVAYATAYPGFDTYDISNPSLMNRLGSVVDSGPNSFKHIVPNGSGLGIAAVGTNPRDDGTHDVYLYDVSDPTTTTQFQTLLATPGIAHAVSIFNGLAYVADGANGLQVVNYLAYDNQGQPPAITLRSTPNTNLVEEASSLRLTAAVTDDVQVRNVEFYVDGRLVLTDGNFPFEARIIAPFLSETKSNFVVRARAFDTGGNSAWSQELIFNLADDLTPPRIAHVTPLENSCNLPGEIVALTTTFNEQIDPATISLRLLTPGPDSAFATADDVEVTGGTLDYRADSAKLVLSLAQSLPEDDYRAILADGYEDLAGNPGVGRTWDFTTKPRQAIFAANATIAANDFSKDNCDFVVQGGTLTVVGSHRFRSLRVANGALVTCEIGSPLVLNILGDALVQEGGRLDVGRRGQRQGQGFPSGQSGVLSGGGSYGGRGGSGAQGGTVTTYGSITQPTDFGSGGGNLGGNWQAGSALRLVVGGTLTVSGVVASDGDFNASGGSVWIECRQLAGGGTIQANGGSGDGNYGGGGGGRVAVYHVESTLPEGRITAFGGNGRTDGGAGTVFLQRAGDARGKLIIANTGAGADGVTDLNGNVRLNADLVITNNAIVSHTHGQSLWLEVAGDASIASGSSISLNARGQRQGQGFPSGQSGVLSGGGSYGGRGGSGAQGGTVTTYGSITQPTDFGSGGGNLGGNWWSGGALRLSVGGKLAIAGVIASDGDFNASGGSVWIECGELVGSGVVQANGGSGDANYGGGGGGRVAVYYDESAFPDMRINAYGGNGRSDGGAGTVFLRRRGDNRGKLVIANTVATTGGSTDLNGTNTIDADLVVRNNAVLSHTHGQSLWLSISGNALVASDARIDLNARGQRQGKGFPSGQSGVLSGGGSYGGRGGSGAQGGTVTTYGSITQPTDFGSGGGNLGGNWWAGGALRLTVAGSLSVDGVISSDGDFNASGGSLWIDCGQLAGAGTIQANGGAGDANYGAGGGGRVAVYYDESTFEDSRINAYGADGRNDGGAGTVFLRRRGDVRGRLFVSNTQAAQNGRTELNGIVDLDGDLIVTTNSILSHALGTGLQLSLSGNAVVSVGGRIDANGQGQRQGPGFPLNQTGVLSGGGAHGGRGGSGSQGGGGIITYGSFDQPTAFGSGGGNLGGGWFGGGAIKMILGGTLTLDGVIAADGDFNAAGGSVWVECSRIAGIGALRANGGNGDANYGGGGGGRVAVYYSAYDFLGTISAEGGVGWQGGAGGTIWRQRNGQLGILSIEPTRGPTTDLYGDVSVPGHVLVRSGAILSHPQGRPLNLTALGDMLIADGGQLSVNGRGYLAATGPGGATVGGNGPGAGHGGRGGNSSTTAGGLPYGSETAPIDLGSGGGLSAGGAGGGAVRLTVLGELMVDGYLGANGTSGSGGGGSGGSIYIRASAFSGFGVLEAKGGNGAASFNGGGGGGRIAIHTACGEFLPDIFVNGGTGFQAGSPGTLHLALSGQPFGGIAGTAGAVTVVAAPPSVQLNQRVSDTQIIAFEERRDVELTNDLTVNILAPVLVDDPADLQGISGVIPAGTKANSYLLHFDSTSMTEQDPVRTLSGSITFSSDVLGIIVTAAALDASDAKVGREIQGYYPTVGEHWRGMEFGTDGGGESIALSNDLRTITLSSTVLEWADQIRVITAARQPCSPVAPSVESVAGSPALNEVTVVFTQLVTPESAEAAGNFTVSGGVLVQSAELLHDLQTVVLRTTPQTVGVNYTVTINGVKNGAGAAIAPNSQANFTPRTTTAGALRSQAYGNVPSPIPNTRLGYLYADARWPDAPTRTGQVNLFQYYQLVFGDPVYTGIADNYGARLSGYLVPPTSGFYTFHVAANDNAVLYLGYSQDPANKRLLASEPEANGYREWQAGSNQASRGNPPANISSPVYLEAGRYYWVETHVKEGTGDDHLGVTWQGPGDAAPVNGGPAIQGAFLAMPLP